MPAAQREHFLGGDVDPFLGEIRLLSFGFAPTGWAMCNGEVMSITQNQALFTLLGTTFGGNGTTTFALPDLRDRVPIGAGSYSLGWNGGEEAHALTISEMPAHTHAVRGTTAAISTPNPQGNLLGTTPPTFGPLYKSTAANRVALNTAAIAKAGISQPHSNMQPFLTISFAIALIGTYPSRT